MELNDTFEFDGSGEEYIKQDEMDDIIDIDNDKETVVEEKINDLVEGKFFETLDELFSHYVRYGNENGFPVKRRTSKNEDDGEVRWVMFACARSGKSKSNSRNAFKVRPISKTNCNAKLDAVLCSDGRWR
ncbi:Far1-related sequence 5-like, partial [Thalictrum thalictroides]